MQTKVHFHHPPSDIWMQSIRSHMGSNFLFDKNIERRNFAVQTNYIVFRMVFVYWTNVSKWKEKKRFQRLCAIFDRCLTTISTTTRNHVSFDKIRWELIIMTVQRQTKRDCSSDVRQRQINMKFETKNRNQLCKIFIVLWLQLFKH